MGSTVSFLNDTDDIIMVKLSANTAVLSPIVTFVGILGTAAVTFMTAGAAAPLFMVGEIAISGAAAGAATGHVGSGVVVFAIKETVNIFQTALSNGYKRDGFTTVLPGRVYKFRKQTLSLNQRMWLIRLDERDNGTHLIIRTADSSVWTGPTAGSDRQYRANDPCYFPFKMVDSSKISRA